MEASKSFYVYEHWRPDTGVCFYVGKGKKRRAWDMKHMRNRHHMAITSKLTSLGLCVDVRIIASNLSCGTAISMEIDRIAMYGMENLSNMTAGGEGLRDPSPEVRAKMSAFQKKNWSDPERLRRASESHKGRITSEETKVKLSLAHKGRKHTPEAIEGFKRGAKKRTIPQSTRDAQKAAITGRKRAPFTPETIAKMRIAASAREEMRRLNRFAA
mgnify:CR=1 FL=1